MKPLMENRLIVEQIPFRNIPGRNKLFISYVEQSPAAIYFYARPPELESVEQLARHEIPRLTYPRAEAAAILIRQNKVWGNDELALRCADSLRLPDAVAVLTGQQVGLYAGPLYTFYKAITAIRLADELSSRGIPAVPIFWMDTDDHDLAEVTRLAALDRHGELRVTDLRATLFGAIPETPRPVGSLELPEAINGVTAEFVAGLGPRDWQAHIHDALGSTYQPGATFSTAFARLMSRLLRGRGMVFFDPHDAEAKALLVPLFHRAIRQSSALRAALNERCRVLLDAGFQPQVDVHEDSTLLFLERAGARKALLARNGRFVPRSEADCISEEELIELTATSPECFSPNVLLRPVAQDHLFPTVAYVGGPAEVAYFAQAAVLYHELGRPMPVIWPRISATVLDDSSRSLMARHGLTFADCLIDRESLMDRLARSGAHRDDLAMVSGLRRDIDKTLDEALPHLMNVDSTLGPAMETARRKIHRNLSRIESRIRRADANAEANLLLNRLWPNQDLQEREWTVHQLIAHHGPEILEQLASVLQIDRSTHFIVQVASDKAGVIRPEA